MAVAPESVPAEVIGFVEGIMERIARRSGWRLSPNRERRRKLIAHMLANWANYGHPYCPCRTERTRETICPCAWVAEEIERDGRCTCGLFYK